MSLLISTTPYPSSQEEGTTGSVFSSITKHRLLKFQSSSSATGPLLRTIGSIALYGPKACSL